MTKEDEINKLIKEGCDTNLISDGYHSFGELYDHRIVLWIALCRRLHGDVQMTWRTHAHSDGSYWGGWFLLGVPQWGGDQITYHLPVKHWDACAFAQTLDKAPDFDGHTSKDVLKRIESLI